MCTVNDCPLSTSRPKENITDVASLPELFQHEEKNCKIVTVNEIYEGWTDPECAPSLHSCTIGHGYLSAMAEGRLRSLGLCVDPHYDSAVI